MKGGNVRSREESEGYVNEGSDPRVDPLQGRTEEVQRPPYGNMYSHRTFEKRGGNMKVIMAQAKEWTVLEKLVLPIDYILVITDSLNDYSNDQSHL